MFWKTMIGATWNCWRRSIKHAVPDAIYALRVRFSPCLRRPLNPAVEKCLRYPYRHAMRTFTNEDGTNRHKSSLVLIPMMFPLWIFIRLIQPLVRRFGVFHPPEHSSPEHVDRLVRIVVAPIYTAVWAAGAVQPRCAAARCPRRSLVQS